jgi:protocatechuate 3,4-dioxygenase beta subunit
MHFMVTAPRFQKLVTHIFVGEYPYIASDTVFCVKEMLIMPSSVFNGKAIWRAPFRFRADTIAATARIPVQVKSAVGHSS